MNGTHLVRAPDTHSDGPVACARSWLKFLLQTCKPVPHVSLSVRLLTVHVCVQIRAGTWEGGHEKRATQYFEVMHQLTGSRIVKYFVMIIVIISLLCTGIAQIIAIATGMYYLKDTISKR